MSKNCKWTHAENGAWDTECGNMFEVTEGTPCENDMKFCCYCGQELCEVAWQDPLASYAVHESGPWVAEEWSGDRIVLQSQDFTHDAALEVTGDFGSKEDRRIYAEEIARRLNVELRGRPQADGPA